VKRTALLLAALSAAAVVGAEWMRAPGWVFAAGAILAAVAAASAARSDVAPFPRALAGLGALAALGLAATEVVGTYALWRVERQWSRVREEAVTSASKRLGSELDAAVQLARGLADRAAPLQGLPAIEAFPALARLVNPGGPSHGVVLFDPQGRPRAWSGVQRTALTPSGPDLSVVTTPFYLWLVARRQTTSGAAVAVVLLARADDVPRVGTALTDRFVQSTGVGLRFLDFRAAPADSDVFDYVRPGTGGDTLFAVQPVPPQERAAHATRMRAARRTVALLALVVLIVAGSAGVRSASALGILPAVAACAVIGRAPLRDTFGGASVFSPDTYAQHLLGPFSSSAGTLLFAGIVVFVFACVLWHRGLVPSWPSRVLAVVGTLLAPYLLQTLANGITPPSGGVTTFLWSRWQLALVVAAGALVLLAAALVRGREAPRPARQWPFVAGAIALGSAVLGLWLWQPGAGWPSWYPYLWTPALLLALRPMPFRSTMATIAVVAGSSAALLTWGATTEGRMAHAARDLEGLGDRTDAPAVSALQRLVHETDVDSAPRTAGELFVLWRRSTLGVQDYPADLAVWGPRGERILGLSLVDLDVPQAFIAQVAHAAAEESLPLVQAVSLVPGVHGIAAIPVGDGRVVTITVGPRSRLVLPGRLARFLGGGRLEPEAPYDVILAPPSRTGAMLTAHVAWRRDGWVVRGERTLPLPGGPRHVHAQIDLRGPSALLQRGALLLVLDIGALAVLWLLVETAAGRAGPALRRWMPRARRSLRFRLSVSLALFFVVPTVVFALWSFERLEDEFRGARQLLLQRTLRDAASVFATDPLSGDSALAATAQRVDAELELSRDGVLWATSAPVLADLGLADLLVPGEVYPRLAYGDEIELVADQRAAPAPTLVGFRLVERGAPGGVTVLASPESLGDRNLQRREADLGIALLVASAVGFLAAILLSGVAARTLAQPLQQLRAAALAVGTGETPAIDASAMPAELEPIRGALAQAASDVEAGRRAQRVLAWGEMARQVAHEIKNPLTPIRLGVQHLLRLGREKPGELGAVLPPTGERILAEIDRLDGIARAFSRFALPGAENVAVEAVDLGAVVHDVVHLYSMGEGETRWEAEPGEGVRALARRDELAEVLVNLCENARDAGARRVVIAVRSSDDRAIVEVRDDGRGIAPELLERIFEPRFSATTSGSGLGLAIARRLVESWGGTIAAVPADGPGTIVRLVLRAAT
jgi:signal transduction histidine kinase